MITELNTSNKELTITRLFHAPKELMWDLFTKPELIIHWWGPVGFTNTIFKMDVKPGGVWDFIMHGPDGIDYKNTSIYKEVVKPEKLVYDHITGPRFQFTVWLTEKENQTEIKIQMLFDTAEQKDKVILEFKADEGLKQNMEKLEVYLKSL